MDKVRHFIIRTDTQRQRASDHVWHIPEGWEVIMRPHKSKRSLQQNACMWAINEQAAAQRGYSKGEFHEIAKQRYQPYEKKRVPFSYVDEETGEEVEEILEVAIVWSTSDFNVEEMSNYLDWLVPFATQVADIDARTIRLTYGE